MIDQRKFGKRDAIALVVTCLLIVAVGLLFASNSPASGATTSAAGSSAVAVPATSGSASCYPASECDGTSNSTGSSSSGYPAAPGAQNGDNYRGLLCPTLVAIAMGGAAPSGGSSIAWAGGTAAATCGVTEFANSN